MNNVAIISTEAQTFRVDTALLSLHITTELEGLRLTAQHTLATFAHLQLLPPFFPC